MIHKKLLKRNEYGMKHSYYFLRQNIVQEYCMVSIKTEKIETNTKVYIKIKKKSPKDGQMSQSKDKCINVVTAFC